MGIGELASTLRDALDSRGTHNHACVCVVAIDAREKPVVSLADTDIDSLWEQPMRALIQDVVEAKRSGVKNIVVVIPTIAMSGASSYALQSAVAEAAHVLVKSAARQWGGDGVVVNCVAVSPELFGVRSDVAGEVSLAPRALGEVPSAVETIRWLCDEAGQTVTGQTIVVDGGLWM